METRRLQLLLELARLGSMRQVADELGITTSTVSQQIAVLAREAGVALIEPDGRRVRLTPAGRRLAGRAVTILAEVEAARLDLDPAAEPAGTLRIAGFATAIRRSLLPIVAELSVSHPQVHLLIREHEPSEALALLATDDLDLALIYDYNLAPAAFPSSVDAVPLWSAPWSLAVPASSHRSRPGEGVRTGDRTAAPGNTAEPEPGSATDVFRRFAEQPWIVNSRNTADEDVVRTVASMAGFEPRIAHRADSLDLVEHLIVAGLGVGLLPAGRATIPGVALLPLADPDVSLRSYALTRRGRSGWPPLALVQHLLTHT